MICCKKCVILFFSKNTTIGQGIRKARSGHRKRVSLRSKRTSAEAGALAQPVVARQGATEGCALLPPCPQLESFHEKMILSAINAVRKTQLSELIMLLAFAGCTASGPAAAAGTVVDLMKDIVASKQTEDPQALAKGGSKAPAENHPRHNAQSRPISLHGRCRQLLWLQNDRQRQKHRSFIKIFTTGLHQ